jgi:hypothetical protein
MQFNDDRLEYNQVYRVVYRGFSLPLTSIPTADLIELRRQLSEEIRYRQQKKYQQGDDTNAKI